jgi:hypothetical protein
VGNQLENPVSAAAASAVTPSVAPAMVPFGFTLDGRIPRGLAIYCHNKHIVMAKKICNCV